MKIISYVTSILGLALISGNAAAQSTPFEGAYFNGFVDYEHGVISGTSGEILTAELNMGFAPRNFGSSMAVGFDLEIDVFDTSFISGTALYPSLFIDGTYGRFSIGLPRSVIGSYISRPSFANSSLDNFVLNNSRRSAMYAGNIGFPDFNTDYGIRYDGQIGNTEFGASYHKVTSNGDAFNIYGLAARHKIGMTQIFGGIEFLTSNGFSNENIHIGFETRYDQFSGGATYSNSSETHVFANYHMNDQIEFNASFWNRDTRANRYGLGVKYGFWEGAYVDAGVVYRNGATDNTNYNVSLGYEF
ncbi:MAG: hypothetical protein V3V13_08380 [Paracoccaceae bacterium]